MKPHLPQTPAPGLRLIFSLVCRLCCLSCLFYFWSQTSLASSEPAKAEAGAPAGEAHDPTAREISNVYVHQWIGMPALAGKDIETGADMTVMPKRGEMQVILFLASWCEPCQHMVSDVRKLAERYKDLHVEFVYVFAHDTQDDALGFLKEYRLGRGMLANHDILKAFHNPELPTIYVGDRHGWMASRYPKASNKDVAHLNDLLKGLTAY